MNLLEHVKIGRKSIRLLFSLSREYTVCLILHTVIAASLPYVPIAFSARLVDALYEGRPVEILALYVVLTVGIVFLLKLLDAFISARREVSIDALYRNEDWSYARKAMELAYESMEDRDVEILVTRIKAESQTGYNLWRLYHGLECIIQNSIKVILSVLLTFPLFASHSVPGWMKPVCGGGILFTVACGILVARKTEKMNNALMEENVGLNVLSRKYCDYVDDYASGKDIRVYGMEENLTEYIRSVFSQLEEKERRRNTREAGLKLSGTAVNYLLRLGIYLMLLAVVLAGGISVGSIARYMSSVLLLLSAASGLVSDVQWALVNHKYLKRYFSYFEIPNDMYQGSLTVEKRDDNEYEVEFRDVSFRYPHTDAYALRHVSLKFKVGEKLAVVGVNGSGKTTFIKLMCRLYDPTEGEILLNGVNIKKYDYDEYMSIFSVVFQDFRLFSFSLGQNVAAGAAYDEGRVRRCLAQAGLEGWLCALPAGTETCLYRDFDKDGIEISGGEAQKIALARALYKDAPFMILDEPTAALDPVSEYEVYSKFNGIAGDKTAVYISHRLASCRFCDKIAVFDGGRVVQTGSHAELIAREEGKYYELWQAQAQYYL